MDDGGDVQIPRMAFLLANWYSGATLLTLLLDDHPQVVSNGEGFYFPGQDKKIRCSCGEDIKACPFYRTAAEGMWRGEDYDRELFRITPRLARNRYLERILHHPRLPHVLRGSLVSLTPGARAEMRRFLEAHIDFMSRALEFRGADLYLDGTKSVRRAELFLSQKAFQSSPVLLLVRAPLPWCASWMNKRKRADVANAVHTWKDYVRRAFRLRARFPDAPFALVQFEQLCAGPEEELARIDRWLGLEPRDRIEGVEQGPHVLGNAMRHSFDGVVRPARDASDGLTREQRDRIEAECRPLMEELGYSSARGAP